MRRNAPSNFLCVLQYTGIINYDKRQARTGLKLALVDVFYVCFVFNNNKKQVTSNSTIITQNTTRQQRSYVGFVCCYLKGNHVELGKMYVAKSADIVGHKYMLFVSAVNESAETSMAASGKNHLLIHVIVTVWH